MSLGVEVSVRGASMVVVLSGTAEPTSLDGLKPGVAAALGEAEAVVIYARTLSVAESAGLEPMLSGLARPPPTGRGAGGAIGSHRTASWSAAAGPGPNMRSRAIRRARDGTPP